MRIDSQQDAYTEESNQGGTASISSLTVDKKTVRDFLFSETELYCQNREDGLQFL